MSTPRRHSRSKIVAFGAATAALVILPAVFAAEVAESPANGARVAVAAAAPSDTSPSCPQAYECLQPGTDPNVPYGTDPSVPYGPETANSRLATGRGSSSYLGGGV